MERLLKLAGHIRNDKLRSKVVDMLKNPVMTSTGMKHESADLRKMPASVKFHHMKEGGLVEHTYSVTRICLEIAKIFSEIYGHKIDTDALLSAALVHDIGKCWRIKKFNNQWVMTQSTIDHTILGMAELYARGFPEEVLHIVASHMGEYGTTEPNSIEAIILHYVDTLDAVLDVKKNSGNNSTF
jgi:7,8-dihydroneopterin 2',3'-cyclic phosphate phosphodiesterase